MKELYFYNGNVILEFSRQELAILVCALGEAGNSVEILEFDKKKSENAEIICDIFSKTYKEGKFKRFYCNEWYY